MHQHIETERNDIQLTIDPDQWSKEECEAVQLYLERYSSKFQECNCQNGTFHTVISDCYPKEAWKFMVRELSLSQ